MCWDSQIWRNRITIASCCCPVTHKQIFVNPIKVNVSYFFGTLLAELTPSPSPSECPFSFLFLIVTIEQVQLYVYVQYVHYCSSAPEKTFERLRHFTVKYNHTLYSLRIGRTKPPCHERAQQGIEKNPKGHFI